MNDSSATPRCFFRYRQNHGQLVRHHIINDFPAVAAACGAATCGTNYGWHWLGCGAPVDLDARSYATLPCIPRIAPSSRGVEYFTGCDTTSCPPDTDISTERLPFVWAALGREYKHTRARCLFCEIRPADLRDVSPTHGNPASTTELRGFVDPVARIGIVAFFRLLESLKRSQNTRGLLKLMRRVPGIIASLPPLALRRNPSNSWPETEQSFGSMRPEDLGTKAVETQALGDVLESIISVAEDLVVLDRDRLASEEQAEVMATFLGLAVKRGSLKDLLQVVRLLLCSTSSTSHSAPLPGVACYLKVTCCA